MELFAEDWNLINYRDTLTRWEVDCKGEQLRASTRPGYCLVELLGEIPCPNSNFSPQCAIIREFEVSDHAR